MPHYLIQAAYTPKSWDAQVKQPSKARDRLEPLAKEFGGSVESLFYSLGEYDVVLVCRFPDVESVSGFSIAANAGGSVRRIQTTQLLSEEQGMNVLGLAAKGAAVYHAPLLREPVGV